jgi:hypothetical protein
MFTSCYQKKRKPAINDTTTKMQIEYVNENASVQRVVTRGIESFVQPVVNQYEKKMPHQKFLLDAAPNLFYRHVRPWTCKA